MMARVTLRARVTVRARARARVTMRARATDGAWGSCCSLRPRCFPLARALARQVLHASVLINALLEGPRNQKAFQLVDKHVAKSMEDPGDGFA